MKKLRMEVANMDFADKLVSYATVKSDVPIGIVANGGIQEEAKQSAISYWTLGWNWDEIESVLEDTKYPNEVVDYAMGEARKHAQLVENLGPFMNVQKAQFVKFKDATYGTVVEKRAEDLRVALLDGVYIVDPQHLDSAATNVLTQAHTLRLRAREVLAQGEAVPRFPSAVDPKSGKPVVKPDQQTDYKFQVRKRTPSELMPGPDYSTTQDIYKQAPEEVRMYIAGLEELISKLDAATETTKAAHEKWQEALAGQKSISDEANKASKILFYTMAAQENLLNEISWTLYYRLHDKIIAFQRRLESGEALSKADLAKKMLFMLERFREKYPEIYTALDKLADESLKQADTLAETVSVYPPPLSSIKKGQQEDQLWGTPGAEQEWVTGWMDQLAPIIEFTENAQDQWTSVLAPEIEEMISMIDGLLTEMDGQQLAASVAAMFKI